MLLCSPLACIRGCWRRRYGSGDGSGGGRRSRTYRCRSNCHSRLRLRQNQTVSTYYTVSQKSSHQILTDFQTFPAVQIF